jgi:hypothetical protein
MTLLLLQVWFFLYGVVLSTCLRPLLTGKHGNDYGTAYRYLTNDKNGNLRGLVTCCGTGTCAKVGVYFAINISFVVFALLWNMLWFHFFFAHTLALTAMIFVCVWNGANFYVEVRSSLRLSLCMPLK